MLNLLNRTFCIRTDGENNCGSNCSTTGAVFSVHKVTPRKVNRCAPPCAVHSYSPVDGPCINLCSYRWGLASPPPEHSEPCWPSCAPGWSSPGRRWVFVRGHVSLKGHCGVTERPWTIDPRRNLSGPLYVSSLTFVSEVMHPVDDLYQRCSWPLVIHPRTNSPQFMPKKISLYLLGSHVLFGHVMCDLWSQGQYIERMYHYDVTNPTSDEIYMWRKIPNGQGLIVQGRFVMATWLYRTSRYKHTADITASWHTSIRNRTLYRLYTHQSICTRMLDFKINNILHKLYFQGTVHCWRLARRKRNPPCVYLTRWKNALN